MIRHSTENLSNVKVKHVFPHVGVVLTPDCAFHNTKLKHVYSEHNIIVNTAVQEVVSTVGRQAAFIYTQYAVFQPENFT